MRHRVVVVGVAAVALVGLALMATGAVELYRELARPVLAPRELEDREQRRREVADAFTGASQPLDGAAERSIRVLFDGLAGALKADDSDAVEKHFDPYRMLAEMERLLGWPASRFGERRQLRKALAKSLAKSMAQNPLVRWGRFRVQRFYPVEGRPEALAYVRHFSGDGPESFKMRWWLVRDGDRWRVYDFEDLSMGMRVSTSIVAAMATAAGTTQPTVGMPGGAEQNLQAALQAVVAGEVDDADRQLNALGKFELPAPLASLRLVLLAALRLQLGKAEESLQLLDQAEAHTADLPMAHFLRATACNQLERYEEAVRHGRRHIELLGDDAPTYELIGDALDQLGRKGEAADAYRMALDDAPDSPVLLHDLFRVLPDGQKREVAERFARLAKPDEHFGAFADMFAAAKDRDGLEALSNAYKAAQDDPLPAYYRAVGQILFGDFEGGAAEVRAAIASLPDEKQDEYVVRYLNTMTAAGRMLDGYRSAPDPIQAFRHLADHFISPINDDEDRLDRLWRLIAAHRQLKPDDVWLDYYEGEAYRAEGDYEAADRSYAAGAAKAQDDETREAFRTTRVAARLEAGKWLSAYQEIGPRKATFDQLAQSFASREMPQELSELIAAHQANDPNDAVLPAWQAEHHWLRKEYGKVVEVLTGHRALAGHKELGWRYAQRLVRSLVRLQRAEDARREFDALPEDQRGPLLDAIVSASSGDVERTDMALITLEAQGHGPAFFYRDEDLGPALRSEQLQELREKYPEPPADPLPAEML
jgi:tetratricopeptide (TPR) repeat protein